MNRLFARLLAPTLAAAVLFAPAVAQAKPAAPKATAPKGGTTVSTMPSLTWNPARGATSYEVQIGSDAGFNPALVDVTTLNLRYLNNKTLPNGAYFWRVRSLDAASQTSKWSGVRKFTKKWNSLAALLTPASLQAIAYPSPAILTWAAVPGASTYRVSIATGAAGGGVDAPGGIISNGALAWSSGGQPIETSNTNLAVSTALHPGTYYWQVVPVDSEGHPGTPSAIMSFAWIWAGTTTPTVTDIVPGVEIYDPLFQWAPIPGAASYQIEINPTSGFATGSKVYSSNTNATSFAPLQTLPNNTYYWRVRGVDPQGQAGPWNNGPPFDKTYDRTVVPGPTNLGVYDSTGNGPFNGANVNEPVVKWGTVPGARLYEVQVNCNSTPHTPYFTANTAFTSFSDTGNAAYPTFLNKPGVSVQTESPVMNNGDACSVRVRAYTDNAIDGTAIFGDWSTISFTVGGELGFSNADVPCGNAFCAGRLTQGDIWRPGVGEIVPKSPLFCWSPSDMNPVASGSGNNVPSQHYWVTIARDSNFTTSVQSAYTDVPCYAPRSPFVDEGTLYYWQVIPVGSSATLYSQDGGDFGGFNAAPSFQHASVPPAPIRPVGGATVSGPLLFQWSPVPEQVKSYTIEVAQDDSFSTILESATTDATAYAATQIYPVGATAYWRVRANNNDGSGLAWSGTSSFVQALPVPSITTAQPFAGATFPALTWTPVDGATSYEVQDVWPDASVHVTSNIPSTAASYTKMTGTGHGTVRCERSSATSRAPTRRRVT